MDLLSSSGMQPSLFSTQFIVTGMTVASLFIVLIIQTKILFLFYSFGLVKSYEMPCNVESASLEPKLGDKFIAGGEDMWIRLFDFNTGEEIGTHFVTCSLT